MESATDLNTIRAIIEPFVTLVLYIVVSGVGISAVTQFLKDGRIPIPAEKYPRTTAAVGAVAATLISLYVGQINLLLNNWLQWGGFGLAILVASALSYNILFRGLTSDSYKLGR